MICTWKWGNNAPAHDEFTTSRAFIIGNYPDSWADYNKLVKEAKKDFPHLTDNEIDVGKITVSSSMKGFILISFLLPSNTAHPEYDARGSANFNW